MLPLSFIAQCLVMYMGFRAALMFNHSLSLFCNAIFIYLFRKSHGSIFSFSG